MPTTPPTTAAATHAGYSRRAKLPLSQLAAIGADESTSEVTVSESCLAREDDAGLPIDSRCTAISATAREAR